MREEFTESLKCDLTEQEVTEQGRKLARLMSEREGLEEQMAAASADYKSQIKAKTSIISRVAELVKNGYEYRQVPCILKMNTPEPGEKTVFRKDTNQVVRVLAMTQEDFQQVIKFEEEAAKAASEASDEDTEQEPDDDDVAVAEIALS